MTPRGIPALRMLPHMGPATTAPARSVNYIVNHMCEHICEPIQSTGRILPGGPGITMCAENTAYITATLLATALAIFCGQGTITGHIVDTDERGATKPFRLQMPLQSADGYLSGRGRVRISAEEPAQA
jgi:hypothetical protein